MTNKIANLLLISDLDSTLLPKSKRVGSRDLSAIARFRAAGGRFTIATGRGYAAAEPYLQQLQPDCPVILYNGSQIYDYAAQKVVWSASLPKEQTMRYLYQVLQDYPQVGAEILVGQKIYVVQMNEYERRHLEEEHTPCVLSRLEDVPDGWLKVLFALDHALIPEFDAYIKRLTKDGDYYFIESWLHYYEMLPAGVSKGHAMEKLAGLIGQDVANIAAAGDYDNDFELVRRAGIGFAVGNATEPVKAAADVVVCNCEDGAISEVIDYLMNLCDTRKE